MSTKDIICEAISKKRLLQFRYDRYSRVVEPHLVGYDTAEHDILCAYLVRGFTQSQQEPYWRTYLTTEMKLLQILDEGFPGPRRGYNPNDKRMQRIYCRLARE
jgi:hypothetical protein